LLLDSLTVGLIITSSAAHGAGFLGKSGANKYEDYQRSRRMVARCPKRRQRARRAVAPCIYCHPRSKSEVIATRDARSRYSGSGVN